jgi:endo-1,4-beta-xylanase
MKRLTRREFLKAAGTASGAVLLTACGAQPETPLPATTAASSPTSTFIPTATITATNTATATSTEAPTATSIPTETPSPTPDLSTLRGLADRLGIEIGVLLAPDEPQALEIQAQQFNFGAFSCSWRNHEREQGKIGNFGFNNDQNQFAVDHSMKTRFQHLFDGLDSPEWLVNGKFSKTEISEFMLRWVNAAVEHFESAFPGTVVQYNVVNEVYSQDRDDFLYRVFKYDYIQEAFSMARAATTGLPSQPKLLYSDSQNHGSDPYNGRNTRLTMQRIEPLKVTGLIDGVACQCHLSGKYPPDKTDMIKIFQAYGLPVYITELDVSLNKTTGSQEERYKIQADIYRTVFEAALESDVCRSITFWGAGYSWLEQPEFKNHQLAGPSADPTLWDHQYQPKPAFFAMRDVLAAALPNQ